MGQPISRVVPGLIALLVPERSDRRGGRSGRLGRDWHVERALQVRADRRGRPLARTTTRRRFSRPWLSREGRGSRGVGVHRSFREGPDWPVRPRPSLDASCSAPTATAVSYARWFEVELLPCWVSRTLTRSSSCGPVSLRRSARTAQWGRVRMGRENDLTLHPQRLARKHIAYDMVYMSHLAGRCTLVRTHWAQRVPGVGSREKAS